MSRSSSMKGKRNAMKGDAPATENVHARLTPEQKAKYQTAARHQGKSLSAWLIDAANDALMEQTP